MLLYSLLKTQHFVIPLSVTVSKAKNFSSSFLRMMIKPGKRKVKNELQKIVEKLMDLKLQKTETSMEISRAIEISRQFRLCLFE